MTFIFKDYTNNSMSLPTQTQNMDQQKSTSVHINPKFKSAHINPAFFQKTAQGQTTNSTILPTNVYVNPKFFNTKKFRIPTVQVSDNVFTTSDPTPTSKIISKSNHKLIREPLCSPVVNVQYNPPTRRLVKVGQRKLVQASEILSKPIISNIQTFRRNDLKPVNSKYKIVKSEPKKNIYRLDRRKRLSISKRGPTTLRYSVRLSENLIPIKNKQGTRKLYSIFNTGSQSTVLPHVFNSKVQSTNRKLKYVSINGVYYKSTTTRLQRATNPITVTDNSHFIQPSSRSIIVRGQKLLVDASGKRLMRIPNNDNLPFSRIYIGGLTYVVKSNDTYERTNNHRTRIHLNAAKHKSIVQLSKNLVKSNVPCPIYRKLGKCRAYERGRCPMVHDHRHVSICPKFLKGACYIDECILSHDVNLSKMPTCKFYLQGICVRSDCPYLHKKVNDRTEICPDFLKGFCEQAEKCNKRHEFLCPKFQLAGNCDTPRCPYPHKNKTEMKLNLTNVRVKLGKSNKLNKSIRELKPLDCQRYFLDDDDKLRNLDVTGHNEDNGSEDSVPTSTETAHPKLSRMLYKIDKMKRSINLSTGTPIGTSLLLSDNMNDDGQEMLTIRTIGRPKLGDLPAYIPFD